MEVTQTIHDTSIANHPAWGAAPDTAIPTWNFLDSPSSLQPNILGLRDHRIYSVANSA